LAANGLAKWDGTSWSSLGFTGVVSALAVDGNNLYVGGSYTNAGGVTTTNIGFWDGTPGMPWVRRNTAQWYAVKALAIQNGQVYVGGFFTTAVRNSRPTWRFGPGRPGRQLARGSMGWESPRWGSTTGELFASGTFNQAGGMPASGIANGMGPTGRPWAAASREAAGPP